MRGQLGNVEKDVKLSFWWEVIEKSWVKLKRVLNLACFGELCISAAPSDVCELASINKRWLPNMTNMNNQQKIAAKYDKSTKDSSQI